jgi:hypothetical protein
MNAPPSVQLGEGTASHIKDAKYLFLSDAFCAGGTINTKNFDTEI